MTHILLVDDDVSSAHALQTLLELDGYTVTALESPERAVELVAQDRFDLIITDLEMPTLNGIEVVRAALAARPGTPVLVATGYAGSPAATAALEAGAKCIIDKPIDIDVLGRQLQAVLPGGGR